MYMPLPDLDQYLERIGIHFKGTVSLDYLNQILWAHQLHVPFENIDIYDLEKQVSLDIPALFDKIVTRKRGGYCFELNGLLLRALQELGFDAYACTVRIVRGKTGPVPVMHEGIIVQLDAVSYYCDVGNGGHQPGGAVKLYDGIITECHADHFKAELMQMGCWQISRQMPDGSFRPQIQFFTVPAEPVDFLFLNEYTSRNPASVFRQQHYLQQRLPDGEARLMDKVFTLTHNDVTETVIAESTDELRAMIIIHFLPDLPADVPLQL